MGDSKIMKIEIKFLRKNISKTRLKQTVLFKAITRHQKHGKHSFGIGCPPGYPRPGDLLITVLANTGLPPKESSSRCFGDWTWDYPEVSCDRWEKAQKLIEQRLKTLYKLGVIRWAEW